MRTLFRVPFFVAALLTGLAAANAVAHEFMAGQIHIDHPWARATPHGARVAGGFLVVTNKGSEPDRLVSATTEVAETTEIHEMTMKDGVMTMRPLADGLAVPAGGSVELKPGGYHLMLVGLKRMLKQGEEFAGTLTFEKAGTVDVRFTVEAMTHGGQGHGGQGHGTKSHN